MEPFSFHGRGLFILDPRALVFYHVIDGDKSASRRLSCAKEKSSGVENDDFGVASARMLAAARVHNLRNFLKLSSTSK